METVENKKISFVFYPSFKKTLNHFDDKDRLIMYDAITDYGLEGIEPNFENKYLLASWEAIKLAIDSAKEKYAKKQKNGSLGGKVKAENILKKAQLSETVVNQPEIITPILPKVKDKIITPTSTIEDNQFDNNLKVEIKNELIKMFPNFDSNYCEKAAEKIVKENMDITEAKEKLQEKYDNEFNQSKSSSILSNYISQFENDKLKQKDIINKFNLIEFQLPFIKHEEIIQIIEAVIKDNLPLHQIIDEIKEKNKSKAVA